MSDDELDEMILVRGEGWRVSAEMLASTEEGDTSWCRPQERARVVVYG
jgi:hypothetical protein